MRTRSFPNSTPLRQQGIISEAEYDVQKKRMLDGSARQALREGAEMEYSACLIQASSDRLFRLNRVLHRSDDGARATVDINDSSRSTHPTGNNRADMTIPAE